MTTRTDEAAAAAPPARTRFRPFGWLGDRIVAADPAFSRLRFAGRAMLTLLAAGALMAGFSFLVHKLPIAAFGLTVVNSFIGSFAVRDPTQKGQMLTRAAIAATSLVSVSLATILSPHPFVADAAFLAVVFVAVYIRKFGMRWFAAGMIAFMSYFMGDYLKPAIADLPWVAFAVVLTLAVSHIVLNYVLKDDRERDFRRAMTTIDRRINLILRELLSAPAGEVPGKAERKRLERHLGNLRDAVLMAEGFVPQGEEGSLAAEGPASQLALALFELQLASERMVQASLVQPPPRDLVVAMLTPDARGVEGWIVGSTPRGGEEAVAARLLLRVYRARERVTAALGTRPCAAFEGAGRPPSRPPSPERKSHLSVPPDLQVPIQITLACGIALVGGLFLSPVRWYWAVIAAFIVFNNTRSRADTAMRAFQRAAGTFAGLIAGTIVAALFHGQMVASGVAILALFFVGFYFLQVSYGVMIFCITIALALIYGMMGMFAPELLLVRLEETIVGAAAGTLTAFLVFPTRTSEGIDAVLDAYFDALQKLVETARARAAGGPDGTSLLAQSRALDRAYTEVANTVRPLGGPWNAVTRFGAVRQKLLLLSGASHWGRTLARGLEGDAPAESAQRIELVTAEILSRLENVRKEGAKLFERKKHQREWLAETSRRPPLAITENEDPAFALEVISAILTRLEG